MSQHIFRRKAGTPTMQRAFPIIFLCIAICGRAEALLNSDWMNPSRIMVIYNTVKMDSVDPAEAATFSHDMGVWYM